MSYQLINTLGLAECILPDQSHVHADPIHLKPSFCKGAEATTKFTVLNETKKKKWQLKNM